MCLRRGKKICLVWEAFLVGVRAGGSWAGRVALGVEL